MSATAYLFGANSTIGQALARALSTDYKIVGISRSTHSGSPFTATYHTDYSEKSLAQLAEQLHSACPAPELVISCIGLLHNQDYTPEKSWPI